MHTQLHIQGMRCQGCASRLSQALNQLDGIEANVNFATSLLSLKLQAPATLLQVQQLLNERNYQANWQQQLLGISGMRCQSCASKLTKHLASLPNVLDVEVNFASEQAKLRLTPESDLVSIAEEIAQLGYRAVALNDEQPNTQHSERKTTHWPLWLGIVCSLPFLVTMLTMLTPSPWHLDGGLQLLLALPVQIVLGWPFYQGAWLALKRGDSTMDTLVSLGTSSAFIFSLYLWLTGEHQLYFETAVLLLTAISIGRMLENKAKRRASQAVQSLLQLRPNQARVWRNHQWQQLTIDEIFVGDRLQVLAGEQIPLDAQITLGHSEIDESLLTGESLPQHRAQGETLYAGSQNLTSTIELKALAIGKNTRLAQIAQLVAQAQQGKSPLLQLVDRISAIFVPSVLVIACATLLLYGWLAQDWQQGLFNAIAVLVIACPCALGLATPAAFSVATGRAAQFGIFFKDLDALQQCARIKTLVLDKTGTLTAGKLELVAQQDVQHSNWFELLCAAQQQNPHPLARAFKATEQTINVSDFRLVSGQGFHATVADRQLRVGRAEFVLPALNNQPLPELTPALQQSGSLLWVSIDGQLHGVCLLADQLRPHSASAVLSLQQQGITCVIASGDQHNAVEPIAKQLQIDEYHANCTPERKLQLLANYAKPVAMFGDGINDGPALAQADVGIAVGAGSDVALHSASVHLLDSDIAKLPLAVRLAKATLRNIRQNLFWAFAFNSIGIPLAALGYLRPELAGAAMAASSIMVLSNALRLRAFH